MAENIRVRTATLHMPGKTPGQETATTLNERIDLAQRSPLPVAGATVVSHLLDRESVAKYSYAQATGVQIGRDFEIILKGSVWQGPQAEERDVFHQEIVQL
jgi:hypothetical protein